MPFPLIPLVGLAVSGSLVAFGVKAAQRRKLESQNEKRKTFAKYAQDHRLREKVEKSFLELKDLKSQVYLRELSRFHDIYENILHAGVEWSIEKYDEDDISPVISSAPMREINALVGAAEWARSGIGELQKQLSLSNEELKRIVLSSGFDFNKYSYQDKGIVLRSVGIATNLNKALKISLLDQHGNFRDNSIDEFEELLTETFEKAA
jgi:hypothetical protein